MTECILTPEQLYWALLDARSVQIRSGRIHTASARRRLGYAFERVLPVSIEKVHAVYTPISESQVLACGIDRVRLESFLHSGALVIQPGSLPDWLSYQVDLQRLNLARFECTPPAIRRQRTRLMTNCFILLIAMLLLVATGWHRRGRAYDQSAQHYRAQTDAIILDRLGPSPTGQLPRLRLTADLRRLRSLSLSSQRYSGVSDAIPSLVNALEVWPSSTVAQTESLTANGSLIRLRTRLRDQQDADALAAQWKPRPSEWTLRQPSMNTQRDGVLLELVAERRISP